MSLNARETVWPSACVNQLIPYVESAQSITQFGTDSTGIIKCTAVVHQQIFPGYMEHKDLFGLFFLLQQIYFVLIYMYLVQYGPKKCCDLN